MKITRFPPEPNGRLHIGHLKAMLKDFNNTDLSYLRMDDTNPLTEKQEFVDNIIEDVDWFGFKYDKITYTSDYFQQLFDVAVKLISMGLAYVDSSTSAEIGMQRKNGTASADRERSIDDNMRLFMEMKDGKHPEGSYSLRLKIDYAHNNTSMRDPVAYRINYNEHYRTGKTWSVYPSYDFAHSLCDSFEKITHSYCTTEFYIRREQYFWVLKKLDMHLPVVEEFNRLVIEDVILSKRKILAAIEAKTVSGFDDPSLFTICGLRNRGYSPESLIHFCTNYVSYTDATESAIIPRHKFDFAVREYFNEHCLRRFAVIDPLKIIIRNFDSFGSTTILRPDTADPMATEGRDLPISNVIYIERCDFKLEPEKKYKRLAPGKEVRLRYFTIVKYVSHEMNEDESRVASVTVDLMDKKKTRGAAIHWVSDADYRKWSLRSDDDTQIYVENNINIGDIVQFERVGYFRINEGEIVKVTQLKKTYKG